MGYSFSGLRKVEKAINDKINSFNKIEEELASEIAVEILNASQLLVPVDTGRLQESGTIDVGENSHITELYVHYQAFDPNTGYEYAPIQHEHLGFNHRIGQAKYLEDAAKMVEGNIQDIAETILRRRLK